MSRVSETNSIYSRRSTASSKIPIYFVNAHDTSEVKIVDLKPKNESMDSLLRIGCKSLQLQSAEKIFTETGEELREQDIKSLKESDALYIHTGMYPYGTKIDEPLQICISGSGAVGKSAITMRIIENKFVSEYDPTIEDLFQKVMTVDGMTMNVSILDTAGQEDFVGLRSQQMRDKDGFLFVYAANNRATFDDLDCFYDILVDITETDYGMGHMKPLIMAGNKCDLKDFDVSTDEALDMSRQYKARKHIYTSAKTGQNINQMMVALVREIINHKYPLNSVLESSNSRTVNCKVCTIM